jgi:hypothetical protein
MVQQINPEILCRGSRSMVCGLCRGETNARPYICDGIDGLKIKGSKSSIMRHKVMIIEVGGTG